MTTSLRSEDFYTTTYHEFLNKHKVKPIASKLLAYEMKRSSKGNSLYVTTVFLTEVEALPSLKEKLESKNEE